jgi:ATP synthase protein I
MKENEDQKQAKSWLKYSQLGVQMLVTIVAGTFFGHWLDKNFPHKLPIFTLCFSLFSIAAAMYNVIRQLPKE